MKDADLLLLDDAHAADGYVAKPWSLEITRDKKAAYDAALEAALDPLVLTRLRNEDPEGEYLTTVYLNELLTLISRYRSAGIKSA